MTTIKPIAGANFTARFWYRYFTPAA